MLGSQVGTRKIGTGTRKKSQVGTRKEVSQVGTTFAWSTECWKIERYITLKKLPFL